MMRLRRLWDQKVPGSNPGAPIHLSLTAATLSTLRPVRRLLSWACRVASRTGCSHHGWGGMMKRAAALGSLWLAVGRAACCSSRIVLTVDVLSLLRADSVDGCS